MQISTTFSVRELRVILNLREEVKKEANSFNLKIDRSTFAKSKREAFKLKQLKKSYKNRINSKK